MNCQDILRIVDAGRFHALTSAQREAAQSHALCCVRCAPVWAAHAELARMDMPPMPSELAARVRAQAVAAASRQQRPAARRWTVVGGLSALAAAAIMAIYLMNEQGSQPAPVAMIQPDGGPSTARLAQPQAATTPDIGNELPVPPSLDPASTQPDATLLLPAPDDSARERLIDQTLQKVAELHPELIQGPAMQGTFRVGALIRSDGSLIDSIVREVPPYSPTPAGTSSPELAISLAIGREIDERISRQGGSGISGIHRARQFLLPNRQALRADTWLNLAVVSSSFNPARSPASIVAAIRSKHPDLSGMLVPAAADETATLMVLLAADGSIEREELIRKPRRALPEGGVTEQDSKRLAGDLGLTTVGDLSNLVARRIAQALSVDVAEIGEIGMTSIEEGDRYLTGDGMGNMRSVDNSRTLAVTYAWRRRPGETAPYVAGLPAAGTQMFPSAGTNQNERGSEPNLLGVTFDKTVAALILKREIPDAFTADYRQTGLPALVLTCEGAVIRAGRLRAPNGGQPDYAVLIKQLVPGLQIGQGVYGVTIRDANGNSTDAALAWEAAPAK